MPGRSKPAKPHKRRGYWYFVKRVPKPFAIFDPRRLITISTDIAIADDPRGVKATEAVRQMDADLMRYWQDRATGVADSDALRRYNRARADAKRLGWIYRPASELQGGDYDDLVRRLEFLRPALSAPPAEAVAAVLGGEERPDIMASQMVDEFEIIVAAQLAGKSPAQKKRWRIQRDTALETFVAAIGGDKPLKALTRREAVEFRQHFVDRILAEEIVIGTGNKGIGRVSSMFNAINLSLQLGLPDIFSRVAIAGEEKQQRLAFASDFVRDKFLAEGMFADLNEEARRIIFVVIETGMRLSEVCNLTRETILLDHNIPHVRIRPDGRQMKTSPSRRDIPLVGVALEALRLQPDGFPRYRDKADTLSGLVNKALEARKLRPEEGQTLYSLRHTFEDRLTAVEAPEAVIANLMGHKKSRPKYGVGPSLELKLKWLTTIAFAAPAAV